MRSIHIVDDEEQLRTSLSGLLSLAPDVSVRTFDSGDAFLERCPALPAGVVLLDLNMPGASGFDVLAALRGDPRFLTVMLTGQGNIAAATRAMKAGAFDFLEKPYAHETLTATLHAAFERLGAEDAAAARIRRAQQLVARLSARERDVLRGLIDGQANKMIAHRLSISPRTVEIYRANLMNKLNTRSLSEALRIAFTAGLFPEE